MHSSKKLNIKYTQIKVFKKICTRIEIYLLLRSKHFCSSFNKTYLPNFIYLI